VAALAVSSPTQAAFGYAAAAAFFFKISNIVFGLSSGCVLMHETHKN
jgi:hypothetical protein